MGQMRRVPWATKAELYELYDWLFSPISEVESRKRGLARMNVYISSPSCPAFMFLLHSLLSAHLIPAPSNSLEVQAARLTSAMVIVRFINGLVDPLQTGPYARPISHIAASLNIPPHLIALRHRATHEDLPSLSVLQIAVGECVDYLHHYSFLPLLAESSSAPQQVVPQYRTTGAEELVKGWKKVMKQRLRDRDVQEDSATGRELGRIQKELQRLVRRGEVGEVIEALCGAEGLVPTAKAKRSGLDAISPPEASLMIWRPLVSWLCELVSDAAIQLAHRLLDILLALDHQKTKDMQSASFRWTIATWLIWIWNSNEPAILLPGQVKMDLWKGIALNLMGGDQILWKLARTLSTVDETLADSSKALFELLPPIENGVEVHLDGQGGASMPSAVVEDFENKVQKMEERMLQLPNASGAVQQIHHHSNFAVDSDSAQSAPSMAVDDCERAVPGWRKLRDVEWIPKPIGIFA